MKRRNKTRIGYFLSLFLVISLFVTSFSLNAEAGKITKNSSFGNANKELNVAEWYDANENLTFENGKLIIPKDSDGDTRIISKEMAVSGTYYKDMVSAKGTMRFTQLPQGEKFILAFGLSNIEAYSGEPNNIEIAFMNQGSLAVEVTYYDENGEGQVIVPVKNTGISVGSNMNFNAVVTTEQTIKMSINGRSIFDAKLSGTGEGRVGLLQTGSCGVEISDFSATFVKYDRPENTNIFEDFEQDYINANVFECWVKSAAKSPAYLAIQEYEGNHVLEYRNTQLAFLSTKYSYSNFELTFDVPYYCRTTTKDDAGNVIMTRANDFSVSFGDTAVNAKGDFYTESTELVLFSQGSVSGYNHSPKKFSYSFTGTDFFDLNSNEGFSVHMKMVDGHLTVAMKALGAKTYTTVGEADYDNAKSGPIKFWTSGYGNCAIDNIRITNLDQDPNIIEVEYKSAMIEQDDFDYQTAELVFREEASADKEDVEEFRWKEIVLITVSTCFVILVISTIISILQRRRIRKMEVNKDEA